MDETGVTERRKAHDPDRISWDQLMAWRLQRHHLLRRIDDLEQVVADVAGLHAQVLSASELSAAARVDRLERAAVAEALWERRSLVKLWATRGTLYLVPARELGSWLSAISTYTKFGNVGNAEIDALAAAIEAVLPGRVLTREELAAEVARHTGSKRLGDRVRHSWGAYLKAASFRGLLCFAPSKGSAVCFTNPRTWLRQQIDRPSPETALRDLVRRFLHRCGPASPIELTRWWQGAPSQRGGQQLIALLGDEACEVDVDGFRAWALRDDVVRLKKVKEAPCVRLLPHFDPWTISAVRDSPMLPHALMRAVFRAGGWISPVVIVNGRIVGTWAYEHRGERLRISATIPRQLRASAHDELEAEARRIARYMGRRLERLAVQT